jgi:hypothetical protein
MVLFSPVEEVMKIVANHYGGKEKPLWNEVFHPDSFRDPPTL